MYVEEFQIPVIGNASISKEKDGFKPWVGGCAIDGSLKDMAEARLAIFNHVVDELKHRKETKLTEISNIDNAMSRLGDDCFNLGQFKSIPKTG